jgi:hypothetical protein
LENSLKKVLILFLLCSFAFGKKDFYYSFINDQKGQMAQKKKDEIIRGSDRLNYIRRLVRENRLDDAYKDMMKFRDENNLKVLNSSIEILFAEILYRRGSKKFAVEGAKVLELAINNSTIVQSDLLDALRLLVKLEVRINKVKEAKFYAKSIGESFDDPLAKAYGKIAEAHIDTHRRNYKRAIKILYKILVSTKNMEVATVVADELYDVYVLSGQHDKAHTLATKVLEKNIEYYANDSYLALKKVDKLVRADMPHLAIKILKKLLENAKEKKAIDTFKFKLANTYMAIKTTDKKYILIAKEHYKDLVSAKQDNDYKKRSKMYIDEILMREGKLLPELIAKKYPHSEPMQDKALLQELLNYASNHEYEKINKMKKIYSRISTLSANRFGYKNMKDVFAKINTQMIEYYLDDERCLELSNVFITLDRHSLKKLITQNEENMKLFNCLLEYPSKQTFTIANNAYQDSKNGEIYFYLERIALQLGYYKDAYRLSQKIDMLDDEQLKSKEFLYRFVLYGKLNNNYSMAKFFSYALKNKHYIEENKNNPLIIDFYYQYYLYLLDRKKEKRALEVLYKLYDAQKRMDAFVYSPFVEMQLAHEEKLDDEYDGSLLYLEEALDNTRKIKDNDLVQIYYEMAKIYEKQERENRYKDAIEKCKSIDGADNMYKEMCDRL